MADLPLEFIVPRGSSPVRRTGCRGFTGSMPDGDVTSAAEVLLTTPLRTAADLGRYLPRLHAVAAIDAFAHARLIELDELAEAALALGGRRNAARLRPPSRSPTAAQSHRGRAGRAYASSTLVCRRRETQIQLVLPDGRIVRLDMGYDEWRVGVEFDGEAHTAPRST